MECCCYCGTSNNLYAFKDIGLKGLIYSCLECYRAKTEVRIKSKLESFEEFKFFCYACERYIPSTSGCERVTSAPTEQRSYLCLNCTARLNSTAAAVITKCSACGLSERINPGDRLCSPCMDAAIFTLRNYYKRIGIIKPEPEPKPEEDSPARLILI